VVDEERLRPVSDIAWLGHCLVSFSALTLGQKSTEYCVITYCGNLTKAT